MPALRPELARLDLLLHREILRLRAAYELSLDEFRGLYISDEQVDALVRSRAGATAPPADAPRPVPEPGSPWAQLVSRLDLSGTEQDLLLLAMAAELERKYETLFAYLNNDVARKWPTLDLAERLFSRAPWLRRSFVGLIARGLLDVVGGEGERRPEAGRMVAVNLAVARFVQGLPSPLPAGAWLLRTGTATAGPLAPLLPVLRGGAAPRVLLEGEPASGRGAALAAFAKDLRRPVFEFDLAGGEPAELAALELPAILWEALILLRGLDEAGSDPARLRTLARAIAKLPGPIFVAVRSDRLRAELATAELESSHEVLRIVWPEPDLAARRDLWQAALATSGLAADAATIDAVASRFRLGAGRIARAARELALAHRISGDTHQAKAELVFQAAREQSGGELQQLASKVQSRFGWNDLVLPAATLARLREVGAAIANRELVQNEWGMGRHCAAPEGLSVLFQGHSGTGKTMAAGIIAGELGFELYRIDLATVVSKYIGETEKNLERIFKAARRSNAILLFDEADALFGKRSEVKDAHDRYANLEVAYLLQRMEEHDGPVILATNLAKNMDQAFARRLHFTVEFPRPDQASRERLWRHMLAPPLPCAEDVDLGALARHFELTGGEIRKTALEAAFAAAADGRLVTMSQLVDASARELQRQGRLAGKAAATLHGPS